MRLEHSFQNPWSRYDPCHDPHAEVEGRVGMARVHGKIELEGVCQDQQGRMLTADEVLTESKIPKRRHEEVKQLISELRIPIWILVNDTSALIDYEDFEIFEDRHARDKWLRDNSLFRWASNTTPGRALYITNIGNTGKPIDDHMRRILARAEEEAMRDGHTIITDHCPLYYNRNKQLRIKSIRCQVVVGEDRFLLEIWHVSYDKDLNKRREAAERRRAARAAKETT